MTGIILLTLLFLAALLGGLLWWQRRSDRQLSAGVRAFLKLENQRDRSLKIRYWWLKAGAIASLFITLFFVFPICLFAPFSWWGKVPVLLLCAAGTVVIIGWHNRAKKEMRELGML
jgi:hypothetical protein